VLSAAPHLRTMRAARLHAVGDLRLHEEPDPSAGPGASIVRVEAVGLCGSDLHWFEDGAIGDATLSSPLVLGHEFAGTVMGGPLDGRLVAVDPAVPCGTCPTCAHGLGHLCPRVVFAGHGRQDGGLRQLLEWPTHRLHPLPGGFTADDGAVLEPLGVALHAHDLAKLPAGGSALVAGCGPIGLLLVQLLRGAGAGHIVAVEALEHRRAAAVRAGADVVLAPDEVGPDRLPELVGPVGVDVSFEVAGADQAVDASIRGVRPGGRVLLVGIPSDDKTTFRASAARRKGVTLMLSRRMGEVYPRAIDLVERGVVSLDGMVSHRYGLADVEEAFHSAVSRAGLKVVVDPSS
jgi:L-iditol 2-dehydrogenase